MLVACTALAIGWSFDHLETKKTHQKELEEVALGSFLYGGIAEQLGFASEHEDISVDGARENNKLQLLFTVHVIWNFKREIELSPFADQPMEDFAGEALSVLECNSADDYFKLVNSSVDPTEFDMNDFVDGNSDRHKAFRLFLEDATN